MLLDVIETREMYAELLGTAAADVGSGSPAARSGSGVNTGPSSVATSTGAGVPGGSAAAGVGVVVGAALAGIAVAELLAAVEVVCADASASGAGARSVDDSSGADEQPTRSAQYARTAARRVGREEHTMQRCYGRLVTAVLDRS